MIYGAIRMMHRSAVAHIMHVRTNLLGQLSLEEAQFTIAYLRLLARILH